MTVVPFSYVLGIVLKTELDIYFFPLNANGSLQRVSLAVG